MALASLNFLAESITMFPFRSSRPSVLCLSNKGNHRDTRLWEGEKTNIFTVALSTSSSHIFSSHSNLSNNTKWLKMAMTRCKVGRRNLGWPCASFWRCAIMATWSASCRHEPHQIVKKIPIFHPFRFVRFGNTKGEIWVEKGDFRGDLFFVMAPSDSSADTHPTWPHMRINRHESDMAACAWPSLDVTQF